ncbi:hypothetical protein ACEPAG_9292 [Sanghuangporus baumii]
MTTARILVDHNTLRRKDHIMKTSPTKLLKNHRTSRGGRASAGEPYKQSFRHRRRARHEALRAHRDRLAQIAQDTFRTVLTIHGYHEDVFTDSDDDTDSSIPNSNSRSHDSTKEGPYYDLKEHISKTRSETAFYPHYSALLAGWEEPSPSSEGSSPDAPAPALDTATPTSEVSSSSRAHSYDTKIEFATSSVLEAARRVWQTSASLQSGEYSLGVLNDASPKRPGGASLRGGMTLEECLVRQTTLIDSLQNSIAGAQFYAEHRKTTDGSGLHDHAMLYSPQVAVIKNDRGQRITPFSINIISSVPVHAGTVRAKFSIDDGEFKDGVRKVMRERMARALKLFEERGDRVLVLSAFGVGQSCNSPDMIGEIWADLLCARDAKFHGVFDKVVFALSAKHRETFEKAFNEKVLEREVFTEEFD